MIQVCCTSHAQLTPFARRLSPRLVSIRNHISSLRHTIRHQQAQLQNLENILHRSSRPASLSHGRRSPSPMSPTDVSSLHYSGFGSPSPLKLQQRSSSFEILHNIAGPDSFLPLPRQEGGSIREGVPADFNSNSLSPDQLKRPISPTRSLSRMCKLIHDTMGLRSLNTS